MTSSKFVVGALAAALGVFVASRVISGVRVRSRGTLLITALVFGVLNALLGTVLSVTLGVLLLPLGILTLGLIYAVLGIFVNMTLLWITDKLLDGFEIQTTWANFCTACWVSSAAFVVGHVL